jgi:hypothetical protein
LKTREFRHIEPFHGEPGEGRRHLTHAAGEMVFHGRQSAPVIDRAEGLGQPVRAVGEQNIGRRVHGVGQQFGQESGGDFGHVAGDDEVPIRIGMMQGREDSSERTVAWVEVGDCRELGVSHEGDVADGASYGGGHGADQFGATKRQPCFVPAHPGTAPPRQHIARARHKEMITLGFRQTFGFPRAAARLADFSDKIRENILGHFCFKLVIAGLTAGAVFGAGPDIPQRVTSVVRPDLRTGKLVRSTVVSAKPVAQARIAEAIVAPRVVGAGVQEPATVAPPSGINEAVRRIAAEHAVSEQLIHSVIKVESNYNAHAISSKGALGLMQLIPATARRFGVTDAFNPVQNIQGGARYLRYLLDLYSGNTPLALAAYNAGEAAVERYGGVPPFAETQNYLILVRRQLELAKKAAAAKTIAAPAPPEAVEAKEAGPAHVVEIVQSDGSVRYVSR